jgi:hypothetical protein
MRTKIPQANRRDALLALERYFIRALLMYRSYRRLNKEVARRVVVAREPKEGLIPILLQKDSYYYLWIGCLNVVVEGWRERLHSTDPAIDELLDSYMADYLKDFRDMVFHFDPAYGDAAFNYVGGQENFEWPDELTDAFQAYFIRELGDHSMVGKL